MTREEAVKILWRYDVNFEPHPAEDVMHAIDMAIDALEQEPIIHCKDCKYYTAVTAHCEIRGKGLYLIRGMEDFCSKAERKEQ